MVGAGSPLTLLVMLSLMLSPILVSLNSSSTYCWAVDGCLYNTSSSFACLLYACSMLNNTIMISWYSSLVQRVVHEQSRRLIGNVLLQGVARVLSKLPSLQSMTQRLRSHSQRVLQPVAQQQQQHPATVDEAEEDQTSQAAEQHDTEAHVVVFVHGFRVRVTLACSCSLGRQAVVIAFQTLITYNTHSCSYSVSVVYTCSQVSEDLPRAIAPRQTSLKALGCNCGARTQS